MPRSRLTTTTAARVLLRHDLIATHDKVQARRLGGGVSSEVILAESATERFVLKQPRARFATEAEWMVDTGRGHVEYTFGHFLERHLGRSSVVPMVAYDHVDEVVIMEAAPRGWRVWKEHLLAREVSERGARSAGRLLRRLHDLVEVLGPLEFRHDELFHQQRESPYFIEINRLRPELRTTLTHMLKRFHMRDDLVHGDFSPKNIFVDSEMRNMRLIDHEVVTRGDAAFDLAFVCTHLLLKAVHMPELEVELHEALRLLVDAYDETRAVDDDPERQARAARYVAPLLLARAIGKSPAEYLEPLERRLVEDLAMRSFVAPPADMDDVLRVAARAGTGR